MTVTVAEAETPVGVSDNPVAEDALAACPGAKDFYENRDAIIAGHAASARGPEFPEAAALRREQEDHLAWLMRPGSPELPSITALTRGEGEELPIAAYAEDVYRVGQPLLRPLPEPSEHGWLDRMDAELNADDEEADAAAARFTAIHDEQPEEPDLLGVEEPDPAGEGDKPGDDSAPDPDRQQTGKWFPFPADDEGTGAA